MILKRRILPYYHNHRKKVSPKKGKNCFWIIFLSQGCICQEGPPSWRHFRHGYLNWCPRSRNRKIPCVCFDKPWQLGTSVSRGRKSKRRPGGKHWRPWQRMDLLSIYFSACCTCSLSLIQPMIWLICDVVDFVCFTPQSWCTWARFLSFFCANVSAVELSFPCWRRNNVQKFLFRSESISCCNNTIWTLLSLFFFTISFLVSCALLSRTSFFWIFKCLSWYEKFRPGLFVSYIDFFSSLASFQYCLNTFLVFPFLLSLFQRCRMAHLPKIRNNEAKKARTSVVIQMKKFFFCPSLKRKSQKYVFHLPSAHLTYQSARSFH